MASAIISLGSQTRHNALTNGHIIREHAVLLDTWVQVKRPPQLAIQAPVQQAHFPHIDPKPVEVMSPKVCFGDEALHLT
jgi:hypothetical protein